MKFKAGDRVVDNNLENPVTDPPRYGVVVRAYEGDTLHVCEICYSPNQYDVIWDDGTQEAYISEEFLQPEVV